MNSPLIRPAVDTDAESAVDVLRLAIIEGCIADHQNDKPTLDRWLRNKTPEQFRRWRCAVDNFIAVAVVNEKICGVGAIRQSGDVDLCYVHPAWQRHGIGRSLLLAMEFQAREWSIHNLQLISTVTARGFYERYGYIFMPNQSAPGYGVLFDYRYHKSLNEFTELSGTVTPLPC